MPFISNGTTILDNGAFNVSLGNQVLISEQTASASASISFTSGIDSTYPIYKFEWSDIHPQNNAIQFEMNLSTDSGSNYNVTKTSTAWNTSNKENDTYNDLTYRTAWDLAQSTSNQILCQELGNESDMSASGELYLFSPSSTTYVKHWIGTSTYVQNFGGVGTLTIFTAGYANTTSAINAIKFQMSSGNIDAGTIKLYGIKDS
jgi:hypothetical protein